MTRTVPNHIRMEGLDNLRDLGGLPTAAAGRTRRFAFLRCESPAHVTDADVALLLKLGVRDVIDLRNAGECRRAPNPLEQIPVIRVRHIPILDGEVTPYAAGGADMGDLYVHMLATAQRRFLEVFRAMLAAGRGVLFHCVAGKDRTGLVAALLLLLAGVNRELVVSEYAATQLLMTDWREREARRLAAAEPNFDPRTLDAHPAYLEKALQHLRRHYIDAEGYLRAIGLTPGGLDALRARLLSPQAGPIPIPA